HTRQLGGVRPIKPLRNSRPAHRLSRAYERCWHEHGGRHAQVSQNRERMHVDGPERVVEGSGKAAVSAGSDPRLRERSGAVATTAEKCQRLFETLGGDREGGRPPLADGVITERESVAHGHRSGRWITTRLGQTVVRAGRPPCRGRL